MERNGLISQFEQARSNLGLGTRIKGASPHSSLQRPGLVPANPPAQSRSDGRARVSLPLLGWCGFLDSALQIPVQKVLAEVCYPLQTS